MTPESRLKAQVELFLSEKGYIPLRLNVGLFYTKNGYPIRTGLPKGTLDLIAIQPVTGLACFFRNESTSTQTDIGTVEFYRSYAETGRDCRCCV